MRIEHIAIWSPNINRLKKFYIKYFNAVANEGYKNENTGLNSYFLSFEDGARLEIMNIDNLLSKDQTNKNYIGYCHLAISVASSSNVEQLTMQLREDGYQVISDPRKTGDGYFESVVLDPDGNKIEITV